MPYINGNPQIQNQPKIFPGYVPLHSQSLNMSSHEILSL